jgi:hypothetical protein
MPKKSPRPARRREQPPSSFADDQKRAVEAAIAQHYARQQEGLPPPCEPHPGYATFGEAWVAHRKRLTEEFPHHSRSAPVTGPPVVLPEPPQEP